MVRLNKPKRELLTREDFETFPVWTWDDENINCLPISEEDPAPEDYTGLFIKASFTTPDGHLFDGYLVGDDDFFHANGMFIDGEDIGFNVNLPGLIKTSLDKIFKLLNCDPFPFFPLRYTTPIRFKGGRLISGNFVLTNGKLSCVPDKSSFE
ncbi:MAG: hypothetical protein K1X28_02540 [Parachlamydiales bacterium]|nr:hypothetical protein [Parachlamydiales bacterium]